MDTLIKYELINPFEITSIFESADVTGCCQFIKIRKNRIVRLSDIWEWFENNPSDDQKKELLEALGYDVSKF